MVMAALWKVPVVFAVCTNQFCEMAYMSEHFPTPDVAPRAAGYGIPYEIVDGPDIETTYEATVRGLENARSGKGPYLIEYKTFRMELHFTGDPGGYVRQEDLDEWGKRDPIDIAQKKLFDRGVLTPEKDERLRADIAQEADAAIKAAFDAPFPTEEDLFTDVCETKGVF
jgi:pyruvate dehydrogenase E1 component alpha subunit